jgi:polyphosphate kinase 2 (PPK2 family)
VSDRKLWKPYVSAYEKCLSHTSTNVAPWYVIPADNKENAQLIISGAILETLRALQLKIPEPSPERHRELEAIQAELK